MSDSKASLNAGGHARGVKVLVRPATLCAAVATLEVVIAVFLFLMARAASGAASGHSWALSLGGVTALLAAVTGAVMWLRAKADPPRILSAAWAARVLPLLAAGVALVGAVGGWVPWIAVPLGLLAAAPVAVLGLVLPHYLTLVRAADTARTNV